MARFALVTTPDGRGNYYVNADLIRWIEPTSDGQCVLHFNADDRMPIKESAERFVGLLKEPDF